MIDLGSINNDLTIKTQIKKGTFCHIHYF